MTAAPIAKVLIVDDERAQAIALSSTLRFEGYMTVAANNAADALVQLRTALQGPSGPFDVLITDLMMPDVDGIALVRAALKVDEHLAAMVMTGHGTIDSAVAAMKNGALDYIEKPFNLTVILSVLSRALAVRRLRLENVSLQQRVSERTRELEASNSELLSVNRELEAFARTISHDLRTPLHAMIGFAELLAGEQPGPLNAQQQEYLREINGSGRTLVRLTQHLLDIARLGQSRLAKETVAVTALVAELLEDSRRQNPERLVEVSLGELPEASADRMLLRQVFANLLSNAYKFTSRVQAARIEIDGWREDSHTVYRVRDNGAGFESGQARSLFVPFSRLHAAAQYPGTGVGLSLVRRIVERHGGQVAAEAEPGKGASFRFSLPL